MQFIFTIKSFKSNYLIINYIKNFITENICINNLIFLIHNLIKKTKKNKILLIYYIF